MQGELDAYDRRILALLQEDASLSSAQIAEQVGLAFGAGTGIGFGNGAEVRIGI